MKKNPKKFFMFLIIVCCLSLASCGKTAKYEINFVTNGGTDVPSIYLAEGEALVPPTDPTKEGLRFGGWYSDVYLTSAYTFPEVMPAQSFNLYAKWVDRYRVLSFETNGGNTLESISAPALDKVNIPDPIKGDALFAGWYMEETFKTAFDYRMPIEDATLYAKWLDVDHSTKIILSNDWQTTDTTSYEIIKNESSTTINALENKMLWSYFGITVEGNLQDYSVFVMDITGTAGESITLKCQNGGVVAVEQKFTMNGTEHQKLIWIVKNTNLPNGSAAMKFIVYIRPGVKGGANTTLTIHSLELYRLKA